MYCTVSCMTPKNSGSWSDPILLAGERRAAVPKFPEGCRAAIFARSAWIWHLSRPPCYCLLIGQWIWQKFKYASSPYASSPSDCSLKSSRKIPGGRTVKEEKTFNTAEVHYYQLCWQTLRQLGVGVGRAASQADLFSQEFTAGVKWWFQGQSLGERNSLTLH